MFITFYGAKELLDAGEGKIKVTCIEEPRQNVNRVEGHWLIHFVPNDESEELPMVTSGRNAKLREPKRLHGLFTLLQSLDLSPISIPNIPNTYCMLEPKNKTTALK